MRFFLGLLFITTTILGCAQNKSKPITEFSQNDTNTGILIDVRTPKEFQAGHLKNAVNIDWFSSDFAEKCQNLDKRSTIYVYCKKGGRSAKAAQLLDSLGFERIVDLEGGYDAYTAAKKELK